MSQSDVQELQPPPVRGRNRWVGNQAGHLPYVDCEYCGQRCGGVDYPLIPATDFPECPQEWDDEAKGMAVTWKEFQELTARSRRLYGDGWELMPGSRLGPIDVLPEGRAPLEFADIEWSDPGGVMFNWALLDTLLANDIDLPHQKVMLRNRSGQQREYGLLHIPVYRMLHPRTLEENGLSQCAQCGTLKIERMPHRPPAFIYLDARQREDVFHLFRVWGYEQCVFASDTTACLLENIQPTGFVLKPWGKWA